MVWGNVLSQGEAKGIGTVAIQPVLFLVVSGAATGLSWVLYFKALQIGDVSQVATVDKLSIALTILLSVIFLEEALSLKTAVGVALVFLGMLVLVLKQIQNFIQNQVAHS